MTREPSDETNRTHKKGDMKRDEISNDRIIKIIEKQQGNLKKSAKALNISRSTLYRWIDEDEDLQEAVEDVTEGLIDDSESALRKKIKKGDTTAIIFHLKTKGKNRGYVERQEFAEHVEQELFPEDEHDDDGSFDNIEDQD